MKRLKLHRVTRVTPKVKRLRDKFFFIRAGLTMSLATTTPDDISRESFLRDKMDELVMVAREIQEIEDKMDSRREKRTKKK